MKLVERFQKKKKKKRTTSAIQVYWKIVFVSNDIYTHCYFIYTYVHIHQTKDRKKKNTFIYISKYQNGNIKNMKKEKNNKMYHELYL